MDAVEEGNAREIAVLKTTRKPHDKQRVGARSAPLRRPPERSSKHSDPVEKAFKSCKERWLRDAGDLDEPQQLKAVDQAIAIFDLLPRQSRYAQHRLRLLRKVKLILEQNKESRDASVEAELADLLKELNL